MNTAPATAKDARILHVSARARTSAAGSGCAAWSAASIQTTVMGWRRVTGALVFPNTFLGSNVTGM